VAALYSRAVDKDVDFSAKHFERLLKTGLAGSLVCEIRGDTVALESLVPVFPGHGHYFFRSGKENRFHTGIHEPFSHAFPESSSATRYHSFFSGQIKPSH
jgi:hypothetical protein